MNEPAGMSALAKVREAAQNRRFDEAETLLSAILVETPTDAEAHTLSFAIAMQRRDFAVARKRAEAALAFLPDNPTFLSNLGAALMQSGDHETAMGHLDAAIEASPDHFTARRNRGMLYAALGRYTDAANDLKVAVQRLARWVYVAVQPLASPATIHKLFFDSTRFQLDADILLPCKLHKGVLHKLALI